ncbi:MAG TPA: protein translocase subunit SecF [Bacteriovoracaceae bacterium]|nr:protein translocase subunit SecF [Bacteriovoracaceae bacterium]
MRNIDFVKLFKYFSVLSFLVVLGTVILFFTKGLNYGVDFRGGVEMQIKFVDTVDAGTLREQLDGLYLSQLQSIGDASQNEFLFKLDTDDMDLNVLSTKVEQALVENYGEGKFEILKTDIVGPKAGEELRTSAFKAIIWAVLAIMIYLALRFDYKFAPGAVVALIHDVLIIIGVFIITEKEFSLQIVAALLAIIGYSVNDTVVIYDRVREVESENPTLSTFEVINRSINETMARTINTSLTTLGVSVVMLIWGGPVIHDFFFAMTVGLILGVYSTIFIAVPMTVLFEKFSPKPA